MFVIFVPHKCFTEGLIERRSVTSQKFKFVNMELVCISRKALYEVIEPKQCSYPPPPTTIYTTNSYFWPRGLFLFVLSGNASLSHNFTNLVFVTSSLPFFINTLEANVTKMKVQEFVSVIYLQVVFPIS